MTDLINILEFRLLLNKDSNLVLALVVRGNTVSGFFVPQSTRLLIVALERMLHEWFSMRRESDRIPFMLILSRQLDFNMAPIPLTSLYCVSVASSKGFVKDAGINKELASSILNLLISTDVTLIV